LIAEIFSWYYPQEIQMHSFDNGTSIETKIGNWSIIKRVSLLPLFSPLFRINFILIELIISEVFLYKFALVVSYNIWYSNLVATPSFFFLSFSFLFFLWFFLS